MSGRLNGDPRVPAPLTPTGRAQVALVAAQLADIPFDFAGHTGFPRTIETLEILLGGRSLPTEVFPELGDVRLGIFEGGPLSDYRDWRAEHRPTDAPPGGESRVEVLARYVEGFERLAGVDAFEALVVMHDVPIRFLANALVGADPLDGPVTRVKNAEVLLVDERQLCSGLSRMRERLGGLTRE